MGVRRERFSTVEQPFAVLQHGSGAGACGIGASLRFGERPAANPFTGGELRDVLLALLLVPRQVNMIAAKRIVSGDNQSNAGVDPGQFFNDDGILDIAEPGTAQILGENGAHQTKLAGFFDSVEREDLVLIPVEHVGSKFGFGEIADGFTQLDLLVGIVEVHTGSCGQLSIQRARGSWSSEKLV